MGSGGRADREKFIREALTARIKMTTEAINVRGNIDAKFPPRAQHRDLSIWMRFCTPLLYAIASSTKFLS